ncbi:hypothetical protein NIES4101_46160 [Calothrix sp. NIES-4101]|nr:hypothetical protein NIES4101_46160 [Calothrix sp. NIES-4101]
MKKLLSIIRFYFWGAMHSPKYPLFQIHFITPIEIWCKWWKHTYCMEVNFQFRKPRIIWDYPLSALDDYSHVYGEELARELFDGSIPF